MKPGMSASGNSAMYRAPWRMAFDGRYKLIKDFGERGSNLLFDLQNDPLENTDISAGSPDVVKRLSGLLK